MSGDPRINEDPRPWWHRELEDRIGKRLDGIERIQRVQTIAFITGAPLLAGAGWIAGRFQVQALAIAWDVAALLTGWAL